MYRKLFLIFFLLLLTGCSPKNEAEEQLPDITATLTVCGDVMSHMPQTDDAYNAQTDTYNYIPMIEAARPWVAPADYAVVNLETTFAGGPEYSGFPAFNSPDALGSALKDIGFDLVSTANNHCLDYGYDGMARTLDVLDSQGIAHVGTYRSSEERSENNRGVYLADVGGIQVAFLSYTYGTNGIPVSKSHTGTVNIFNKDYMDDAETLADSLLYRDLKAAKALNPDLIAVMIHWGEEYKTQQNDYQEEVADFLFRHGADIILGGHPHVLQPMELRTITDEDGGTRTGFVCWSLGNFISAQNDPYTDTTVALQLTLTKNLNTGVSAVTDVNYIPMFMLHREKKLGSAHYMLLDARKSMQEYEEKAPDAVSEAVYQKLQACVSDCREILGTEWEE